MGHKKKQFLTFLNLSTTMSKSKLLPGVKRLANLYPDGIFFIPELQRLEMEDRNEKKLVLEPWIPPGIPIDIILDYLDNEDPPWENRDIAQAVENKKRRRAQINRF